MKKNYVKKIKQDQIKQRIYHIIVARKKFTRLVGENRMLESLVA